ncbi:MAG: hypothetical protein QOH51_3886 [Acidobacteriota bacterium]|jgi:hypothetical protein|nr:hypothetical protein [Acidobacteriota bacterium]
MKKLTLICGLVCVLFMAAACASPAPANGNVNTTSNANVASRNAAPAANTAAAPAANSNTTNANSAADQSGKQDFTLVNKTGVEIDKVYISPHDKDDWEEDILGQDTLPDGQSVDIKFHRDEKAAQWDLRIEDKQGHAIEWENLNLLEISKVTLHYKDAKATAEVE